MFIPLYLGALVLDHDLERFGTSDRDTVIGEVYCVGTERELLECSHPRIGSHRCDNNRDIIISCYGYKLLRLVELLFYVVITDDERGCANGEMRLQGGFGPSDGHVEFCVDRVWGQVCSDGWDANTTKIACRQLGFDSEGLRLSYTLLK